MRISDWSSDVCSSDLAARGIVACASCHGAAGNSSIPANPNLAAQPHEYLAKQLADFQTKQGADKPARNVAGGNHTPLTAMALNLTPEDLSRSEEHTSELQSLIRISYAVLCFKKKTSSHTHTCILTQH